MKAFIVTPFVAATTWYILMLCTLAFFNGQLRWRTDVLAMAIGAVILGVPSGVAITLFLAIPMYVLIRSTVGVSLGSAAAGGSAIGLVVGLLVGHLGNEWVILSPFRGVLVGVTTASVWWRAAGRPNRG
jgi:hypothetical protein